MNKNNKRRILIGAAVAVSALLPLSASAVDEIPAKCLQPFKVLPEVCKQVPVSVCLDYFKDRVRDNQLASAAEDASEKTAAFCLQQFREQLLAE